MNTIRISKAIKTGTYNEWIFGYVWQGSSCVVMIPSNLGISFNKEKDHLSATAYEVIPETVCKSTGMDDKRTNSLYENDIVTDGTRNYIIKEHNGMWMKKNLKTFGWSPLYHSTSELVRIGNKFSNPELMPEIKEE